VYSIANYRRILFSLAVIAAVGAIAYCTWWLRTPVVPHIPTADLDAEVVTAIEQASAAVRAQPRSGTAWGHLGMVLFAQDMYVEAIPTLAEAQRWDPADPRWPYFRGLALILQDPDAGVAVLEQAARMPPPAFHIQLRLAEEYFKRDRLDEADALFEALLAKQPNEARALLGRGLILSRRGQWQAAVGPLLRAAVCPTATHSARAALAQAYGRLGDDAAAQAEERRATGTVDAPWSDPYIAEAQRLRTGLQPRIDQTKELLRAGRVGTAHTLILEVLRDHPESDEARLWYGKVLIREESYAEAAEQLHEAIRRNPDLVEAHFYLAGALMLQKDYAGAERSLRRTIELNPRHGLAHFNLGDCRLKLGDKAEALAAFRDAVRCRPDLERAHLELGLLLIEAGQPEEAAVALENAVRLDPKNERARRLLDQAKSHK
jgi:tetratricopeptide (TPR) repeat protein